MSFSNSYKLCMQYLVLESSACEAFRFQKEFLMKSKSCYICKHRQTFASHCFRSVLNVVIPDNSRLLL